MNRNTDPGIRHHLRHRLAVVVIALAAVGSVAGSSSPTANAWVDSVTPVYQGQTNWGWTTGAIQVDAGYSFRAPVIIIYHNNATNVNFQQYVTVSYALQRWTGAWTTVAGINSTKLIGNGATGNSFDGPQTLNSPTAVPGYYRIQTTILWGTQSALPYGSATTTGWKQLVPSAVSDFRCNQPRCYAYAGYAQVWG